MIVLEIPLQETTGFTAHDIKVDLAVTFYSGEKMSLAKAAKWCGLSRLEFQKRLADKKIPLYSEEMLSLDLQAIKTF